MKKYFVPDNEFYILPRVAITWKGEGREGGKRDEIYEHTKSFGERESVGSYKNSNRICFSEIILSLE